MLARFPPPSGSTLCSLGVCSGCDLCAACIAFCPLLPATACLAGIGVLQADQRSALQQPSMRASFPPAKTRYLSALEGDKGQRQRVLKAGEWYVAGESAWHPELLQTGDIIEFPVYEDDSSLCGNMIAKVTVRYKEDQFGRAFDATPLACSHKDFRRFMENDMKKKTCRFHLCRSDGSECDWECKTVKIYLHVDAFCRLMDLQAEKKIAAWSRDRKKTYDIIESVSVDASDADSEERPKGKVKLTARAASDDDAEASEEPPLRRRKTDAATREERAKGSLDEALGHLDTDAGPVGGNTAATSSRPSAAEKERADFSEKVAELKARLAGRGNAGIAAVNSSVLAERAAAKAKAAAVSSASSAAGNRPEASDAALKRLLSSFAGDGDLAEDSLEVGGGALGNRRMLFRRIAKEHPGKLSLQTIHDLRMRMDASDVEIPADEYSPIFLRYLLQVYSVHNPPEAIGVSAHRELRHYAEIADGVMRGNLPQVLDLVTQAFKAKMLQIEDGGDWSTARWLHLIPEESLSAVPEGDVEAARRIQASKLKEIERAQRVKNE